MYPHKLYELESQLVADILIEFGAGPELRIWRTNTGRAYGAGKIQQAIKLLTHGEWKAALKVLREQRPITFGTPGTADICGIIHGGRWLCIEAKIGTNAPSEDQINWRAMMERHGAIYILCYQVNDVYLGLQAAGVLA